MVHHQLYVCLRQFIKASSFRQDSAYKFMSHLDLCFLVRRTWIAVIDPRPLKSFSIRSVLYTPGVANNATTQYISFESKKLYTVIGQEWSEFYLKATANILSLLDTVKGIIPDENKAIYATNKIKKASSWNVTIDNYNYLKQGIAEADKILEDLDLDEDSEILAFLKLVSEGKATILNLTDEILAWIKAENLADKMFINF